MQGSFAVYQARLTEHIWFFRQNSKYSVQGSGVTHLMRTFRRCSQQHSFHRIQGSFHRLQVFFDRIQGSFHSIQCVGFRSLGLGVKHLMRIRRCLQQHLHHSMQGSFDGLYGSSDRILGIFDRIKGSFDRLQGIFVGIQSSFDRIEGSFDIGLKGYTPHENFQTLFAVAFFSQNIGLFSQTIGLFSQTIGLL